MSVIPSVIPTPEDLIALREVKHAAAIEECRASIVKAMLDSESDHINVGCNPPHATRRALTVMFLNSGWKLKFESDMRGDSWVEVTPAR